MQKQILCKLTSLKGDYISHNRFQAPYVQT